MPDVSVFPPFFLMAASIKAPAKRAILLALALSLVVHAGVLALWTIKTPPAPHQPLQIRIVQPDRAEKAPPPRPVKRVKKTHAMNFPALRQSASVARADFPVESQPASLAAPSAPSAEEWRLASAYTLRNGKRYRYAWSQQVRSMMGTAVEGPDQGQVRFRIEIAPDGKIAKVEELWSTSEKASKLAMQAIRSLPPLPPPPGDKPLVFEQTISFLPYETGWPPSYTLDCLPEPEPFKNPYAWNGASPQQVVTPKHRPPPPEGCPSDSTAPTIEEEEQSFKRQMDQWRWGR